MFNVFFLARKMAKVEAVANMTKESYSGFFTVNKTYDSNMFFWFFPSEVLIFAQNHSMF